MNKKLIITIFTTVLTLTACGSTVERNGEYDYISESESECSEIIFTCSQFKMPFNDSSGCGCEDAPQGEEVSDAERTLKFAIKSYLTQKLLPMEEGVSYETIVDYLYLNGVSTPPEDESRSSNLQYEVWAVVEQYEVIKDTVELTNKYAGPIIFSIEETGLSYTIWDGQTFEDLPEDLIASSFTENSAAWILDLSDSPSAEIKAEMQSRIDSKAEGIAGLAEVLYGEDEE
jgi:hypothetical protein